MFLEEFVRLKVNKINGFLGFNIMFLCIYLELNIYYVNKG